MELSALMLVTGIVKDTHHKKLGQGYKRKMAEPKNWLELFMINKLTA
jgi:hypothetical protein